MKANRPTLPTTDVILAVIAVAMLTLPLPILFRSNAGDLVAKALLLGAIILPPAVVLFWAQVRYGPGTAPAGSSRR